MKAKRKIEFYGIDEHDMRFASEESCRDHLVQIRWGGQPTCPKCQNNHMNYYLSTRRIWKCSHCAKHFSVVQGTIFEASNLSLKKWFKAIYYFTTIKRGFSSCQLAKWLSVEQKTAWFIMMRLREALREEPNKFLRGIIEIDETYIAPDPGKDKRLQAAKHRHEKEQDEKFGFSKNKKTRIRKKLRQEEDAQYKLAEFEKHQKLLSLNGIRTPFRPAVAVLGMLQVDGEVVLHHIGNQYLDTTKNAIAPYLLKNIDINSIIITDQSSFYTEVGKLFKQHRVVNHDVEFVTPDGIHTNGIENCWTHFSRVLSGTYFHLSFGHFFRYLNEHSFRWNIKKLNLREQCDEFFNLVFEKRVSYKDIITSRLAA